MRCEIIKKKINAGYTISYFEEGNGISFMISIVGNDFKTPPDYPVNSCFSWADFQFVITNLSSKEIAIIIQAYCLIYRQRTRGVNQNILHPFEKHPSNKLIKLKIQ